MKWRPPWARTDEAMQAINEAQQRSEKVERHAEEVARVTQKLQKLGRENHFQDSVRAMFGIHR